MNTELMKKRRKELKLTQQDLADKCGLSKNTIYNYENGRVDATNENLEKISKVLDLDILDLILEDELCPPADRDFGGVIALMQENLLDFIEIIVSKNLKTKEQDSRYISEKILHLINSLSGSTVILSNVIERIIFFNIDTQKFSMCYFETFESYILNILSISDNLLKNKLGLNALHLTSIFENEYKYLKIDKKRKEFKNNNEFLKAYLKEFNQNIKEGGSDE